MNKTNISWTDFTWNPVTGCTAASTGCKNCYAKIVHERFYDTPFSDIVFHEERIKEPQARKKPAMIFIGSMTDLFQDGISDEMLNRIMHTITQSPQHTFQILTKRPERMKAYFETFYTNGALPIKNLWLGVTAENQEAADERIPVLLNISASTRFVSIEPMIGEIDLLKVLPKHKTIDWAIIGGESGTKKQTRIMKPEWVQRIYEDCKKESIPFIFKQWGPHRPNRENQFDFTKVQDFPSFAGIDI